MKIVPHENPLNGSDNHKPATDVIIGVHDEVGVENRLTTPAPEKVLMPLGDNRDVLVKVAT